MGRIEKQKRELIEEANKRLLGEQMIPNIVKPPTVLGEPESRPKLPPWKRYDNDGKVITLTEREKGTPITNLRINQPLPNDWFEQSIGYISKAIGYSDIFVSSDMSTADVVKIMKSMSSDNKRFWGTPKVLYENSLESLEFGTHGEINQAGCGRFYINDSDGMGFLKYVSKFTTPTTKVYFTGCYTGNDPFFISRMAAALGVNEVVANTSKYYPGRFWNHVPDGYRIACPSINKIKDKEIKLKALTPQEVQLPLEDEEIKDRINQLGCRILNK